MAELTWCERELRHAKSGRLLANDISLDNAARAYPGFVIRATLAG